MGTTGSSYNTVQDIFDLFQRRGDSQYGGESVTQLEHALQAAHLAMQSKATNTLVAAALLHDVGHLLHDLPDDAPDQGTDDHHESSAGRYLNRLFPAAVTEPVRLHVEAKRYLCAVDGDYAAKLSTPSITSLKLQGGPMSPNEVEAFRQNRFYADAVELRRWDDAAKVPGLTTPPLEHYAEILDQLLLKN